MSRFLVYGLVDPRTGLVRYVGKSTCGLRRPNQHRAPGRLAKAGNTHNGNWIRKLQRYGLDYSVTVIAEFQSAEGLFEAEQFWIDELRSRGFRLTNASGGGPGLLNPTPETRAKMSKAHLGQKPTASAIAAAVKANTGRKRTLEQRARISASRLGKKPTEAARRNMSLAATGRVTPEHVKEKLSAALTGRPSPFKGRVHTDESRRQTSLACGGRPFQDQNGVVYYTVGEAAKALGLNKGNLHSALTGRQKTTGGYVFTYCEEQTNG